MLSKLINFNHDIFYIQLYQKTFHVKNIVTNNEITINRHPQYVSPRMVFAYFTIAEQELKPAIKALSTSYRPAYCIFHPMELTEGGIMDIERTALSDLGRVILGNRTKLMVCDRPSPLTKQEIIMATFDYK